MDSELDDLDTLAGGAEVCETDGLRFRLGAPSEAGVESRSMAIASKHGQETREKERRGRGCAGGAGAEKAWRGSAGCVDRQRQPRANFSGAGTHLRRSSPTYRAP